MGGGEGAGEAEHLSKCFGGGSFKITRGLGGPCTVTLPVLPPRKINGAHGAHVASGHKVECGAVAPGYPIPGDSGHSLSKLTGSEHSYKISL